MVPFIDVVLVLLIIFMVMSPFLAQSHINVRLPKAVSAATGATDDPVKVHVTRTGDFYVEGRRVLRNAFSTQLEKALAQHSQRIVLIEADGGVPFKNVVFALDIAEQLKTVKVGVGVQPLEP
jgi:biopolymer transport protein ExbD